MTFKDQLKNDSLNIFLNTNEFSEVITYTPKGGVAKTIKAIVDRQRVSPASEDGGRTLLNDLEIQIANDATYGVTLINKGFDVVAVAEIEGGANKNYTVADILGQDPGMWHLLLRA